MRLAVVRQVESFVAAAGGPNAFAVAALGVEHPVRYRAASRAAAKHTLVLVAVILAAVI
jgi:hypothetical protein